MNKRLRTKWALLSLSNPVTSFVGSCVITYLTEPDKLTTVSLVIVAIMSTVIGLISSAVAFSESEYLWNPEGKKNEVLGIWSPILALIPFYGVFVPGVVRSVIEYLRQRSLQNNSSRPTA